MTFATDSRKYHGTPLGSAQEASRPTDEEAALSQCQPAHREPPLWSSNDHAGEATPASSRSASEDEDVVDRRTLHAETLKEFEEDGLDLNRPTLLRVPTTVSAAGIAAPYVGFGDVEKAQHHDQVDSTYLRRGSVKSSLSKLSHLPSNTASATGVSTDAYGNTYPEGGLEAWLCVFGSFCGLMAVLGLMNTIGTYQAWLSTHQLSSQSSSSIGWIFGIYAFLSFFCGVQIGPVFDAKGPRWLVLPGSILTMLTSLLLGICTEYWHFVVVFGVIGGIGTSLVFTPAFAAIGHHFLRRRGQCTGLAAVGGSLGGIVFPLTLQALLPRIGWAWSTRVVALVNFVLLIFANLFIKSRLPPQKATKEAILPDFRIFRDPVFALLTLAVFFIEWGLFLPLGYLTSYALAQGVSESFSYQLLAILNVGSCFGRYFPGLLADKYGRFNAMVVTILLCLVSAFGIWLPARDNLGVIIFFAIIFGVGSGSGISLTPVCVGQLCKVENYGRYYATCYTLVSFGSLTGIPIAGALISACGGKYWGLIVFTGSSYAMATIAFVLARGMGGGWKLRVKY